MLGRNYKRLLFAFVLAVSFTGAATAQLFLSPAQLAYLQEQFLRSVTNTIPGNFIIPATLPVDRLTGVIPASQVTETDALGIAAADAVAGDLATEAAANDAEHSAINSAAAALAARVTVNEGELDTWTSKPYSSYTGPFFSGAVTNHGPNHTNTVYYESGLVVSNKYEGP